MNTPQSLEGLVERLRALPSNKQLRFSICDGAYRWQSVRTNERVIVDYLTLAWNHRDAVLAHLSEPHHDD